MIKQAFKGSASFNSNSTDPFQLDTVEMYEQSVTASACGNKIIDHVKILPVKTGVEVLDGDTKTIEFDKNSPLAPFLDSPNKVESFSTFEEKHLVNEFTKGNSFYRSFRP
ncbi:unnamed protein product [marine sediment metagenome]|uniref:Uncharacterized protein n=1 Tax=marine sediment metagenome TaxID=412755 RepID=X0V6I7_9ZZZZ